MQYNTKVNIFYCQFQLQPSLYNNSNSMDRYGGQHPNLTPNQEAKINEEESGVFQTSRTELVERINAKLLQNHEPSHQLPSVRQFLSQPNPLMNKIQFIPYHPKSYYPRHLIKLPKCLSDYSCIMTEKNNMNLLSQACHVHDKLKKNILDVLISKNKNLQNLNLVTIQQYYALKLPIYERYHNKDIKLDENKLKLKYYATYVLDMAKILKKQYKLQQKNTNTQPKTNTQITQIRSSSKCGNFSIRQRKSSCQPLQNAHISQMQKPSAAVLSSRNSLHSSQVEFESNFQSGNLFKVFQKQFDEYDLILQNDINTKGNTQWFFFSVKNVPKNTVIKFNIVNMSKSTSLFNFGMKPYVFSMMRYEKRKVGWLREGQKVSYEQSQTLRKQSSKRPYFVLSFEYKFLYDGDVVYFSHSLPYTLTDLSQFLNCRLKDKSLHKLVRLKNVGLTLGSNQVDLLEITNTQFLNKNKKSVWIIARQHPGETTSGLMLEGIIDFLISCTQEAKTLLNNFVFKIVPMVNVDGVIHGNSRAQFIGHDPNRLWSSPHKLHNPIIHSIKHYIERQKDNIELFLDLHSHSRKLGTFFYGNTLSSNTAATRIYPLVVCKNDSRFEFKNSRFSGGSDNAARSVLFQSLKIPLIYTVESSFYGYQAGDFRIVQYLPQDYKEMGASLMKGFLDYELKKNSKFLKLVAPSKYSQIDLEKQLFDRINDEEFDKSSIGSDSEPDQDEYNEKEFKKLITIKENKKKKPKKKQKEPQIKIIPEKEEEQPKKQLQVKVNNSESYYREYFSGRLSFLKRVKQKNLETNNLNNCLIQKKESKSFGVQINLVDSMGFDRRDSGNLWSENGFGHVLTERNGQQPISLITSKFSGFPVTKAINLGSNKLCVIGQKVQEISVLGTNVGIQVSQNKEIFSNKQDGNGGRKNFSVRQRVNSFLQVKENNFLQRGDCMARNFFSRK